MRKFLLSPDPPDAGPGAPANPPPQPPPAAPPAAKIVLTGEKSERETSLETELEAERNSHARTAKDKKDREVRIAELEDQLHKLKTPPQPKAKSLLDISEFFEED
jgi:hypothetical protein